MYTLTNTNHKRSHLFKDITGKVFNSWTVIGFNSINNHRVALWNCICVCGNKGIIPGPDLRRNHSKSCGCQKAKQGNSLINKTFGHLTVLKKTTHNNHVCYLCKCTCGNNVITYKTSLTKGTPRSLQCKDCQRFDTSIRLHIRKWLHNYAVLLKTKTKIGTCPVCGIHFTKTYIGQEPIYCSYKCRHNRRLGARRLVYRAKKFGSNVIELIDPYLVFERDSWTCQICGCSTPRSLRGSMESNAPEIDHIIPLFLQGNNTYENTRTLCKDCNHDKAIMERKTYLSNTHLWLI